MREAHVQGLSWLILIAVVIALVVAAMVLWPRLRGQVPAAVPPMSRPRSPRQDDPDQVDEAVQIVSAIGGQVRPGDAMTIQIADPVPWGLAGFELDVLVAAVSHVEIRDASGLFSFMTYWMPEDQEAAIVAIEGDVPVLAEVFVGRRVLEPALAETLIWCRDRYLADTDHAELDFDLSEHGLGSWTAYAAREGGSLCVESGTAPLAPAGAAMGSGLPYRDCLLHPGHREDSARLRLVQIGTFAYAFQGEIVPVRAVSVLRRTTSGPA